jgi:hypothetical protein
LIEMCAATLTEVDRDTDFPSSAETHDRALAHCIRLESLSHAHGYTPAVWLALSQLHTLRHVDLTPALPRLHSLGAFCYPHHAPPAVTMAGFFEDLLPRLRVFSFRGSWARKGAGAPSRTTTGATAVLVLEELNWDCASVDVEKGLQIGQGFIDAQPTMLHASSSMIADWLLAAAGLQCRLLARVRRLVVVSPNAPAELAEILAAAPELRHLCALDVRCCIHTSFLRGRWAADLVHHRLRSLQLMTSHCERFIPPPADCATRLQERHFPRLRAVQVCATVVVVDPDARRHRRSDLE